MIFKNCVWYIVGTKKILVKRVDQILNSNPKIENAVIHIVLDEKEINLYPYVY